MKWELRNPANILLPAYLFVIFKIFYSLNTACIISLSAAFLLFFYGYFFKKERVLNWYMVPISLVVIITVVVLKIIDFGEFRRVVIEINMLLFFLLSFLFKKIVTKLIISNYGKLKVGIKEIINLFFTELKLTIFVFIVYIISFFIGYYYNYGTSYFSFLIKEESILLFLLWLYFMIKAIWLKYRFNKEEYWPILNDTDKVIGYELKENVYYSKKIKNPMLKNIHPMIRILFISDNKFLLKKNDSNDICYSDKWDLSISSHLLYGETYKECINRLLKKNYNIEKDNTRYILKYTYENHYERQLVFLHYMLADDIILQNANLQNIKLWTFAQISEELDSNIFTDKLKKEIILLNELSFHFISFENIAKKISPI